MKREFALKPALARARKARAAERTHETTQVQGMR